MTESEYSHDDIIINEVTYKVFVGKISDFSIERWKKSTAQSGFNGVYAFYLKYSKGVNYD